MITRYELSRILLEFLMPALYLHVRHDLAHFIMDSHKQPFQLLDVGGRKSPYTVGLRADVSIIDLPRQDELQENLKLGLTKKLLMDLKRTRSNVKSVTIGDMLENNFPDRSFDGSVCIEVIEHVDQDVNFLKQIYRVLKPGGWLYLSTPNGDYIKNEPPHFNPDHKRHYKKDELDKLLSGIFDEAITWYGIKTGKNRFIGLRSMDPTKPFEVLTIFFHNLISNVESIDLKHQSHRTAHIFAIAKKK